MVVLEGGGGISYERGIPVASSHFDSNIRHTIRAWHDPACVYRHAVSLGPYSDTDAVSSGPYSDIEMLCPWPPIQILKCCVLGPLFRY